MVYNKKEVCKCKNFIQIYEKGDFFMDKKHNSRIFSSSRVSMTFVDGRIISCIEGERFFPSSNERFYEVLKLVMKKFANDKPQEFVQLYKSLYFSTREYKIASKIYKKLSAKDLCK